MHKKSRSMKCGIFENEIRLGLPVDLLFKEFDQLVLGYATLFTSVSVAKGDGAIFFDGVEVDGDAEGCTDFVLATVSATDCARGVVEDVPASLQFLIKSLGDLD